MTKNRDVIGKGLSSLFSSYTDSLKNLENIQETTSPNPSQYPSTPPGLGYHKLEIASIIPNPDQPRKYFAPEEISSLADSIREHGVLQPILVRVISPSQYQIISGERRYRASKEAGATTIPAIIVELDDRESFAVSVVENIQRNNLTPIEEASAYQLLTSEHGYTHEEVSSTVGKSRSYITNLIRLLKLPSSVQDLINEGKITTGHAKAIASHPEPEMIAKAIIDYDLNVRQVESIVREDLEKGTNSDNSLAFSVMGKVYKSLIEESAAQEHESEENVSHSTESEGEENESSNEADGTKLLENYFSEIGALIEKRVGLAVKCTPSHKSASSSLLTIEFKNIIELKNFVNLLKR